jgi:hypothetical protein
MHFFIAASKVYFFFGAELADFLADAGFFGAAALAFF